ncbi:BlaI/MecI/CopY family transcriptional regulator [Clostridioides difficile]|nr:BlaI/MecI/CopY family transcriptional regulator [Clostridioides difficile]
MIQQLSDAELEIMKIIWSHDEPVLFAFLLDELTSIGKTWQKNTLITLLARLMDKGYLKAKKLGRRNEYTPLISESEYQTSQTKKLLDKIYEGNVKGLVSNLIQSDLLTDEEYDELKELLEGGKDK